MPTREARLAALIEQFRAWGVADPESWARSEIEEGINQYARLVFLRGAWALVQAEGDTAWMDRFIENARRAPDQPGAGAAQALERLLAAGASRDDLVDLIRWSQYELLFGLMYQLADPQSVSYPDGAPEVTWGLFELDDQDRPVAEIGMLHESVLGLDPTGREMRPRRR